MRILVFDQAESTGGSIDRMIDVITELPEYEFIFCSFLHRSEFYKHTLPNNCKFLRLYSFFSYRRKLVILKHLKFITKNRYLRTFLLKLLAFIDWSNMILLLMQIYFKTKHKDIDLVISNSNLHNIPIALAKYFKIKLIAIFRSLDFLARYKNNLPSDTTLIAISIPLREKYCEQLCKLEDDIQIIPSPIDAIDRLKKYPLAYDLTRLSNKKIITHIGRICQQKGQLEAIYSFINMPNRHECALLLLGALPPGKGSSRYFDHLKKIVLESDVSHNIFFLGYRVDSMAILQKSDLFIHTAIAFEGLGGAIVEAMQLGKPVIASNIGGPASIIKDTENGFLYDGLDISKLTSLMTRLTSTKTDNSIIGKRAMEYSLTYFNKREIALKFSQIVQNIDKNSQCQKK